MAGFDMGRVIAAFQAGQQAKQAKDKLAQDAEDRKFTIDVHRHQLKALQLGDKAAAREEALQNQQLNPFPAAPEVSTAAPQTTTAPIPTSLTDPSQMSEPQTSATPNQSTPLPLPTQTLPGVYGPDTQLPVTSLQQHLQQLKQKQQDDLNQKLQEEVQKAQVGAAYAAPTVIGEGGTAINRGGQVLARGTPKTAAPPTLVAGRDYPLPADVLKQRKELQAAGRAATTTATGGTSTDAKDIAQAIIDGTQSPLLTGLYGKSAAVRAELARKGYNHALALSDWNAVQKHLSALNGQQQERLRQAISFTAETLPQIEDAYHEWKKQAGISGFKVLNRAALASMKQLPGSAGSAATNLEALISDFTSELGTVYKGGNSSTDESLKLAALNLSGNWNEQTFNDAVKRLRTSLQIRSNSITNSQPAGVSPNSPYLPPTEKPSDGGWKIIGVK